MAVLDAFFRGLFCAWPLGPWVSSTVLWNTLGRVPRRRARLPTGSTGNRLANTVLGTKPSPGNSRTRFRNLLEQTRYLPDAECLFTGAPRLRPVAPGQSWPLSTLPGGSRVSYAMLGRRFGGCCELEAGALAPKHLNICIYI